MLALFRVFNSGNISKHDAAGYVPPSEHSLNKPYKNTTAGDKNEHIICHASVPKTPRPTTA